MQGFMYENQKEWDMEVVRDICNDRDSNLIQQIPIPARDNEDTWFWLLEDKGDFSVKSCYRQIHGEQQYSDKRFWRQLWSLKLPGKVLNLLWRACRNVVPTAVELAKKNVHVSTVFCWCNLYDEDTIHVLFGCSFAQDLWKELGLQQVVNVWQNDTVMDIFQRMFQAGSKEQCGLIGLLCWGLWSRRNKWMWEKINTSVFGVKSMVFSMLAEWQQSLKVNNKQSGATQGAEKKWVKPAPGWIKVNVDAACKRGENRVKVGCVARDENGQFVRVRSNVLQGQRQPREAKLRH